MSGDGRAALVRVLLAEAGAASEREGETEEGKLLLRCAAEKGTVCTRIPDSVQ